MPASTILLIDADADVGQQIVNSPGRRRLHRHDHRRCRRRVRQGRRAPARDRRRRRGREVGGRRLPEIRSTPALARSPSCASARPTRSRSGSSSSRPARTTSWPSRSTPASSRRGSRRCCSGSSDRRTSRRGRLGGRSWSSAPAHGRGPQPEGRRRDDDGRDEHRDGGRQQEARPGRPRRPRPAVRPGRRPQLNIEPKQTLADVVRDDAAMKESELLRAYAASTTPGSTCSPRRPTPELAELVTPEHVDRSWRRSSRTYDQVVIDAGSWLDERTMIAFEHAETRALRSTRRSRRSRRCIGCSTTSTRPGRSRPKSVFVLNNMFAREILKPRDVEHALGTQDRDRAPVRPVPLPQGGRTRACRSWSGRPKSVAAERFSKLATAAFGSDGIVVPEATEQKRSGRFGLRRR